MNFRNEQLLTKPNGKPVTNKDYNMQGWNAAVAGIHIDDCPYYPTSTAEKHWKAGHRGA